MTVKILKFNEENLLSLKTELREMGQLAISNEIAIGSSLNISTVAKIISFRGKMKKEESFDSIDELEEWKEKLLSVA